MRLIAHARLLAEELMKPGRPASVAAGAWRRMDAITRAATSVAESVVSQVESVRNDDRTAVALATGYGSVHATFRFVGDMAAHGDAGASPTPFIASVHNAAAGAVGVQFGFHGPSTTISQGSVSCLAALRWADLVLREGRCDSVLIIAGDVHHAWSQRQVAALTPVPWAIGSGVAAVLVSAGTSGPGWRCSWGEHPASRSLDGGGVGAVEARLAREAEQRQQQRLCAGELLGAWWPTATACALPDVLADPEPIQIREQEGSQALSLHLEPPCT
jgi:hypothetical protein